MSTSVSSLSGNFFPSPQNGFSTTLASSISAGASTVPLNSVAGYSNGDIAVLVVDPANGSKQTFTGVVDTSGVQLTSVVWTAGTNVPHLNGATVTDYVTATHIAMMSKGIKVAHNQDGSHKSGAVYTLPTITDFTNAPHTHANAAGGGQLTASAFANNAITAPLLDTAAITLGHATSTAQFTTTSSTAVAITSLSALTVTIPAGGRLVEISAHAGAASTSNSGAFTALSIWDGTVGSGTQLDEAACVSPAGGNVVCLHASALVTPSAGSKTYGVGLRTNGGTCATNGSATNPVYLLVKVL